MMGKTHMAVGIAAALALADMHTVSGCLGAVLGGAVGGLICDIDVKNDGSKDANYSGLFALIMAVAVLGVDWYMNAGICRYIMAHVGLLPAAGIAAFAVTCICGRFSPHRAFMHSLPALALLGASLYFVYEPVVVYFAAGFLSHILLDMLNKKPVRIFWPLRRGICLNLCYANGAANACFFVLGLLAIAGQAALTVFG